MQVSFDKTYQKGWVIDLKQVLLTSVQRSAEVKALDGYIIGERFLQFLDRYELCDAPPDTPLFASNSVQNEVEARLSIGFSAKGSIVSMLERSLSLVASKKTGFTIELDLSTVPAFKIQNFICSNSIYTIINYRISIQM